MEKIKSNHRSIHRSIGYFKYLNLILLCLCSLGLFNTMANNDNVETQKMNTVSLNIKNKTLKEVLSEIEKKSGYLFFFYDDFVNSNNQIQLKVENKSVTEVLNKLFENSDNTYEIDGRQVFIKRKIENKNLQQEEKEITVTGKVVDEQGDPLPGASVFAKESGRIIATSTGTDGNFTLKVPAKVTTITVAFVGYTTKEVPINESSRIAMTMSVQSIEGIVVTGIFNRKVGTYTGSATTLTAKDLQRVGNQNVFESLKNLDPSMRIISNLSMGSDPNTLPDMQLRGTSTFMTSESTSSTIRGSIKGSPSAPLIIVNGFESTLEYVNNMDMNRVESISILKDASAKAIYGSKAANGVIVIETKRLRDNETRVTYSGGIYLEVPDLTSYDLTNAREKLEAEKLEGLYDKAIGFDEQIQHQQLYNDRLNRALAGEDTYWLSKPLRTGIQNRHSIIVEMGENNLKSLATFSYQGVEGVMKGSGYHSIAGDVDLSYRKGKILFRNLLSVVSKNAKDSPYGSFSTYVQMNPYWNPYDSKGNLKKLLEPVGTPFTGAVGNPLYDATLDLIDKHSYMDVINNFSIRVDISKEFAAIAQISASARRLDADIFYPADHSMFANYTSQEDLLRKGIYNQASGKNSVVDARFDVHYNKTIRKSAIFADVTFRLSEKQEDVTSITAEGFPAGKANNIAFARQYALGTVPNAFSLLNRTAELLGFVSYTYDNKYYTDMTLNRTGSSVFGSDKYWNNFWSVGVGWNVHNEKFLKGIKGLRQLRLRSSYGLTGNDNYTSTIPYATYKYNTQSAYNDHIGAQLKNMGNPDLQWQETNEWTIALDADYKNLSLKLEYYDRLSKNTVTNRDIAPSTGFFTVSDNLGEVSNTGIEAGLNYKFWQSKDGFLNVYGSIVTNNNKIVKISDNIRKFNDEQMKKASQGNQAYPVLKFVDGMPVNTIWAVPSLGIDPMSGLEIYLDRNGNITTTWDPLDELSYGTLDPKWNGLVGISGEYKRFGINVTGTFLGGCNMYNYTLVERVENVDLAWNVDRRVLLGRWNTPGQNAEFIGVKRYYNDPVTGQTKERATQATSRFIQKRNEFTLSSISAYYDFSNKVLKQMKLANIVKQLKLSFYMNNIETFSTIKVERGTRYPFARNFSFSLNTTF